MDDRLIPPARPLPAARRVLVLAPHADDEVFGCGGAVHLLVRAGATVSVVVVTDGAPGTDESAAAQTVTRDAESCAAAQVLGYPAPVFWRLRDGGVRYGEALVARVLEAVRGADADLVFAPSLTEIHPDHQTVALAAAEAVRRIGGERTLAFYEVSAPLVATTLVDISAVEETKLAAMRCFSSQLALHPYEERIAALNRYRSYTMGKHVRAAEAFFTTTAADLSAGLAPLFESPVDQRRRLGAAADAADIPLVSVIVRSMDRPSLSEALGSIAAQTYSNIEVVLVNAKGGAHSVLPDFAGRLALQLVETGAPLSRSRAANLGLSAARGEFLAFLDDDDTLDPDHLSTLVATLRREGDTTVAYSGVRCIDRSDPQRNVTRVFAEPFEGMAQLLAGNFIPSHAALFSRRLLANGARFDETLDVYEDWDFWLQLARMARFTFVDRITATYFTGGTSGVSPVGFEAEAVRKALAALTAKWKSSITLEEFRAVGELYHRAANLAREREREIAERRAEVADVEKELRRKEREVTLYQRQLAAKEADLTAVFASRSWRVTGPVRAVSIAASDVADQFMRWAYRGYTRLPLSARTYLAPLIHPVRRGVRRRIPRVAPTGRDVLPYDYESALAALREPLPPELQFPIADTPDVSVVIVDSGHAEETLRTLAALRQQAGIDGCEVIVVAHPLAVPSDRVKGVRLERATADRNADYARGAASARAPWIVFFSGAAVPLPGFLAEVRNLARQHEAAVLVPKLVGRHAQLIFPVGNDYVLDPNVPEANFVRPSAICPAPVFAVNKLVVSALADSLKPSRGWMTTLADTTRHAGQRMLYAPHMRAVVPDDTLPAAPLPSPDESPEPERRILILDQLTPTPDRDSGSVDAYFQMKILTELGYRVTFAPTVEGTYSPGYTADLQRLGVECLYSPYTPSVVEHLEAHGERYDYVVLTRLPVADDFLHEVRRECPNAIVVFNTVDLHFLREQGHAALIEDAVVAQQARNTRRREMRAMREADATLVISELEQGLIRREAPDVRTFHLPLIMDIADRHDTPFALRRDVVFIGGFRHLPNVDAVVHFVRDIWPRVRARLPDVRFHVIGGDAPPEVRALAAPDVLIHGHVPDAAPLFNECRLSVAPLRFGAGVKGKVARSLGYGCPVVLTPVASEGTGLGDGVDALIAADDAMFADAVVRLYQDEALWSALSRQGSQFFDAHFSLTVGKEKLASIFDALQRQRS